MSSAIAQPGFQSTPETRSKSLKLSEVDASAAPQHDLPCDPDTTKSNAGSAPEAPASAPPVPAPPPGPVVTFNNGELTVEPHEASLREVIEAIRKRAGISVEYPPEEMNERVFGSVGPTPLREALMKLLYGSGFNYIIQTSYDDPQQVRRLILSAQNHGGAPPVLVAGARSVASQNQEPALYGAAGFSGDESAEAAPVSPPVPPTRQPRDGASVTGVPSGFNLQQAAAEAHKTPGQLLDEMQKRQLELLDAQTPPE